MTASLKTKIYLGFAVIAALLLTNAIVASLGQKQLRDSAKARRQVSGINATVLTIAGDVQELRLRVDRYVASGHESLRDETKKIHGRIEEQIRSLDARQLDSRFVELFELIEEHLAEYEKQFDAMVEERRVREELVQVRMPDQAEVIHSQIAMILDSQEAAKVSDEARLAVSQSQAAFSDAEKYFLRYFENPDSRLVRLAITSLGSAAKNVEATESESGAATVESIESYEQIGLRAVQATRSYLFLRNVVMAAEAAEVVYYAKSLRQLASKRITQIDTEVATTNNRVNWTTGTTTGVALLLATLLAGGLAYLIVPPITALTKTFVSLSDGHSLDEIPGVKRNDEIGKMAQAARVFSDQNKRTRKLLNQSEALGRELEKKAEELQETNSELDSFAYVASHDLKSPLRGIRQLAVWIKEDAEEVLTGSSMQHLQLLQSRVTKMELLLDDLLKYSRVGRLKTEPEVVDAYALIESIVEITDNPEQVKVRYPDHLPTFTTLRAPLERVLLNLIGNAIKHNHRGPDGVVEVEWTEYGDDYRIAVADNGPGIDVTDHERVFQMYQRVGSSEVDGSGMGLALVKKQIELLGGKIELQSSLGNGSTFAFTWPTQPNSTSKDKDD